MTYTPLAAGLIQYDLPYAELILPYQTRHNIYIYIYGSHSMGHTAGAPGSHTSRAGVPAATVVDTDGVGRLALSGCWEARSASGAAGATAPRSQQLCQYKHPPPGLAQPGLTYMHGLTDEPQPHVHTTKL